MARQSSGFEGEAPTMVQMFTPAKGARGGRVGRAPGFGDVMTQYGYGTPGANITVSPTFSNIGNPNVNVTGPSMGDVTIRGGGGGGGGTPGNNRPGSSTPGSNGPGSNRPGSSTPGSNGPGSSRPGSSTPGSSRPGDNGPDSRDGKKGLGLKDAVETGQEKNPRITLKEIKEISAGKGPKGLQKIADRIEDKGYTVGNKAQNFLNRQLDKVKKGGGSKKRGGGGDKKGGTILNKNLSTGGGIGRRDNQRPGGQSTQQKIRDIAGKKLTASEVNRATKELGAKKVLNQIQKGNIKAGKKAIAKAKAARRKGKK